MAGACADALQIHRCAGVSAGTLVPPAVARASRFLLCTASQATAAPEGSALPGFGNLCRLLRRDPRIPALKPHTDAGAGFPLFLHRYRSTAASTARDPTFSPFGCLAHAPVNIASDARCASAKPGRYPVAVPVFLRRTRRSERRGTGRGFTRMRRVSFDAEASSPGPLHTPPQDRLSCLPAW